MHNLQQQLRQRGKDNRSQQSSIERASHSEKISASVINSSWFQRSKTIACYLPAQSEVCTWSIIERAKRMKKRIFAPVIEKNHVMRFRELSAADTLHRNNFGLLEPKSGKLIAARALDVVITPIVAFDSHNNRIGMGGGYFDRTFAFLRHRRCYYRPKLIGVAFACQEVDEIPSNPWDIRVFGVITEKS